MKNSAAAIQNYLFLAYILLPVAVYCYIEGFLGEELNILWVVFFFIASVLFLVDIFGIICEVSFRIKHGEWDSGETVIVHIFFGDEMSSKDMFYFSVTATVFYLIALLIWGWALYTDTPWYNIGH